MSTFRHEELDPQWEQRIVRHLDGELDAEEELAFQRDVLRDVNARGMLDDYRKIDEWVSTALSELTTGQVTGRDAILWNADATSKVAGRRFFRRAWWMIPAAMAAVIAWFIVSPIPTATAPQGERIALTGRPETQPNFVSHGGTQSETAGGLVRPVSTGRKTIRDIDRDLVGVIGDDGNIYWFQVDRTRTLRGADDDSNIRLAAGDW